MSKITLGNESLVGSLTPSNKKSYKLTNRIQEGRIPLYSVVFNSIDARFFNCFVSAGGNGVKNISSFCKSLFKIFEFWVCAKYHFFFCLILGFWLLSCDVVVSLVRKDWNFAWWVPFQREDLLSLTMNCPSLRFLVKVYCFFSIWTLAKVTSSYNKLDCSILVSF